MQKRVNADIEATNKSLYSQIFGGIGGFDTYSSVVPNLYQDDFKEGSFIGKGIYDLEIFEKSISLNHLKQISSGLPKLLFLPTLYHALYSIPKRRIVCA
jgi:hypothetical protein